MECIVRGGITSGSQNDRQTERQDILGLEIEDKEGGLGHWLHRCVSEILD